MELASSGSGLQPLGSLGMQSNPSHVAMTDAEFDSLLASNEFQDVFGAPPADAGGDVTVGDAGLADPISADFNWDNDVTNSFLNADAGGSSTSRLNSASAVDLASPLTGPSSPSSDPTRLDPLLPISDVEQLPGPTPPAAPSTSNTPQLTGSGLQSGGGTPTAISEAGARFADATLTPPDDSFVRPDVDNGATMSQDSVEANQAPQPKMAPTAAWQMPAVPPHMQTQYQGQPGNLGPAAPFTIGSAPSSFGMHPARKGGAHSMAYSAAMPFSNDINSGAMMPGIAMDMAMSQAMWPADGMWQQPGPNGFLHPAGQRGGMWAGGGGGGGGGLSSGSGASSQSAFNHPGLAQSQPPVQQRQQQYLQQEQPQQQRRQQRPRRATRSKSAHSKAAAAAAQPAQQMQQQPMRAMMYPGAPGPHNAYCMPQMPPPMFGMGLGGYGMQPMGPGGVMPTPGMPPMPPHPGFITTPPAAGREAPSPRGASSQPGTPKSEALVLEELKHLIEKLDPATKSTMKDSLYRISRNAQGSTNPSESGAAATAAAAAARNPSANDEISPVDRMVADLLYKEPQQQAPNLPQQLAVTARAQQQAAVGVPPLQPQAGIQA